MVDVGEKARSREGHAAMSMRGGDNRWIQIQNNTFKNWVNEQLRPVDETVTDLELDFDTGVKLCLLMEAVRGKKVGRIIRKPMNQHQYLENVTLALKAMQEDKIKLVNIGSEDIVNGNLKLILGLVWHLILRYQIGKTKFPPKKLMLAWLNAVIPECNITNFTSCWNDGVALHALLDYCRPGLCPNWRTLSRSDRLENCRHAMELARETFGIPLVVRPEDLSSSDMDELSGMTYLSYFMKLDSPGYNATLRWVRDANQHSTVNNFTTDWSDGYALCALVKSLGGNVPGWPNIDRSDPVASTQLGIDGALGLGIEPILTAEEMVDSQGEHLGVMAYAAYFQGVKPVKNTTELVTLSVDLSSVRVGHPTSFKLAVNDPEIESKDLRVEVHGPSGKIPSTFDYHNQQANGTFTATEPGLHTFSVYCNDSVIKDCPMSFNATGDRNKIQMKTVDICPRGALTHLKIDTSAAGDGQVRAEGLAPSGATTEIAVSGQNGNFSAAFEPHETGVWRVSMLYDNEHVQGSPFSVNVFDPAAVSISGLDTGSAGQEISLTADCSLAGMGDLTSEVTHNGTIVPSRVSSVGSDKYNIVFTPSSGGEYKIDTKFCGYAVKDSPHTMTIEDSKLVTATGPGLGLIAANRETSFDINGAGNSEVRVEVKAPDNSLVPVNVVNNGNSTYRCDWTPKVVGDHQVEVSYAGMPIKGSPFTARVCNAANVKVTEVKPGRQGKQSFFKLDASEAGPGNLEIVVAAHGQNVANFVKAEGNAKFEVSYTPESTVPHQVSVKFNNEHVPGSPFISQVVDGSRCVVSGDNLQKTVVNRRTRFSVDPRGAGEADCEVEIFSPSGAIVPNTVSGSSSTNYTVEFTPKEVGHHKVNVKYADVAVAGSPFECNVYNPDQVKCTKVESTKLGSRVTMDIDCRNAGEGDLSAEVRCRGEGVPCEIVQKTVGVYELSFVPKEASTYTVDVSFNDEQVPNAPMTIDVVDDRLVTVQGDAVRNAAIFKNSSFIVNTNGSEMKDLNVRVVSPTQKEVPIYLARSGGAYRVDFTPAEVGGHHVHVNIGNHPIQGSPFTCYVYDVAKVNVVDMSETTGTLGKQMFFTVDASAAGQGDIDVEVNCNNRLVRASRENLGDNRHRYSFIPEEAGIHTIDVTYNYEKVKGSPFSINVIDPNPPPPVIHEVRQEKAVYRSSAYDVVDNPIYQTAGSTVVETRTHRSNLQDLSAFLISLGGTQYTINDLQLVVTAPNGEQVPAKILKAPNGEYKVEYSTTHVGRHTIDIYYNGQRIGGSPYFVDVFDPQRVRVDQEYSKQAFVNQETGLRVFSQEAGRADLTAMVYSPSGQVVPHQVLETANGTRIAYNPAEYGIYKIYAYYGGVEVPGCPIVQEIRANQANITAHGDGLMMAEEGSPATFYVDSHGAPGDLFVQVGTPNSIAKCNIIPEREGYYRVTYTPVECGVYDVQIKWNDREINGSPFHPQVIDTRRVAVVGGWHSVMDTENRVHLVHNETKRIVMDTGSAGPGTLEVTATGPDGVQVPVHIQQQSDGKTVITFTPIQTGEHRLNVLWCKRHIPGSPFLCYCHAVKPAVDHTKVILTGKGLVEAKVNEETEFTIDGSQAGEGTPFVIINGMKKDIPVFTDILGGDRYRIRYTPEIPGAYLLHIQWSDRAVKDSPFKINVMAMSDASKVLCSGDGLKMGIYGSEISSVIDTRRAGPGELTAQCTGPSKVAYCELFDHRDGTFTLKVKAQEAGRHLLHVHYGGENVPGSPFTLKIAAPPDARKVRVKGPGVEHGILATFQSRFLVETQGAGAGQLTVRIRGPRGGFRVEMQRESSKDRSILCRYDPTEVGDYVISVRWSGDEVPGSPFNIQIFDTHEELDDFIRHGDSRNKSFSRPNSSIYDDYGRQRSWNAEI